MKTASVATKAILAIGIFFKAECYTFVLAGGTTYRFTTAQVPLTVGGNTYGTGLTIKRGGITQKVGLEVQGIDLTIIPQWDSAAAPILIGGVPFLQAVRSGIFDGCRVSMGKVFLSSWADTSPGLVPWTQGRVNNATAGRLAAQITVNDDTEILNVSMPKNIVQAGCLHMLFDAGCTLSKASFTSSGATTGTPTVLACNTNLTQADGFFDLGILTWTSGANNGASYVIKTFLHTSGVITPVRPFAAAPGSGDTFTAVPGCDKRQTTCNTKFSNLAHHRGMPYVPAPETLYDGGTQSGQVATLASQGGAGAGSTLGGSATRPGNYQP